MVVVLGAGAAVGKEWGCGAAFGGGQGQGRASKGRKSRHSGDISDTSTAASDSNLSVQSFGPRAL